MGHKIICNETPKYWRSTTILLWLSFETRWWWRSG